MVGKCYYNFFFCSWNMGILHESLELFYSRESSFPNPNPNPPVQSTSNWYLLTQYFAKILQKLWISCYRATVSHKHKAFMILNIKMHVTRIEILYICAEELFWILIMYCALCIFKLRTIGRLNFCQGYSAKTSTAGIQSKIIIYNLNFIGLC